MENFNHLNISAFAFIISILGGFLFLLAINLLFGTALAEIPIFLIGLIWTASSDSSLWFLNNWEFKMYKGSKPYHKR